MQKITLFLLLLFIYSCNSVVSKEQLTFDGIDDLLVDKNATKETKALYANLKQLSKTKILYGHQDDLAYGVDWWNIKDRSDIKEVCGSYPAVFGWEISKLGKNDRSIDSVLFTDMHKWIVKGYEMGAVNTISWHMDNPVTNGNSWDKTSAVKSILPGGNNHEYFKKNLRTFAGFNAALVDKNGTAIPIIFRPFHEHNGSWFWWGKENCTKQQYIQLWQFTIGYLRDSLNVHNLIYTYSPDGQYDDLMERYPGDEYVDILGVDYYFKGILDKKLIENFTNLLAEITDLAKSKNKLAVLSETGYESIPDSLWYTYAILNPIKRNKHKIEIAYMLNWRNANKKHHFAPYPGHPSANDFMVFYSDSITCFSNDLKNIYK